MPTHFLDELSRRIAQAVPERIRYVQEDFEKTVRTALEQTLSKLSLVTREEFEVQTAVLAKTREKLHALEEQVAQLRDKLEPPSQQ